MGDLAVIDSGDEEEAESEATASVAIAIRDDFEAFEHGDDVLAGDAFAGDGAVSGFVVPGQRVLFAALFRHLGLAMQLLQSLIAAIDKDFSLRVKMDVRLFEQPEVVPPPLVMRDAQNAARRFLYNHLRF